MSPSPFTLAAITDEFSPSDLERALDAMTELGMSGAELRRLPTSARRAHRAH
jgi:hypothetical protein